MSERADADRLEGGRRRVRVTDRPAAADHAGTSARTGAGLADLVAGTSIGDVQRLAGNAAAAQLVATRRGAAAGDVSRIQRQRGGRGGRASAPASMSRTDFEAEASRQGVGSVVTGTLEQQVTELNALSAADRLGDVLRADVDAGRQQWVPWDPGASSPVYRAIIAGLADFAAAMGGLPPIRQIVFFKREYRGVRVGGELRSAWGAAGADYSAGVMRVYENAVLQATRKVLPSARDTAGAAAGLDQPTEAQGIGRVITHELGHGLQEVLHDPDAIARAAGPLLMERYAHDIGWRRASDEGGAWQLFDVGDPAVREALDAGSTPDDRYRITPDNWQQGWHEQPISAYQVRTGPFEDFPEAVMAFIANRPALQRRSPARHDFVQSVITELAGRLGTPAGAPANAAAASSAASP